PQTAEAIHAAVLLGPAFCMIYPVVGPVFAYGTGTDHWAPVSLWAEEIPSSARWAVAKHPWVSGPLLILAMTSVIYGYVRTTALGEPSPTPARQPEPQPELI
ncbi:hypothetical protein K8369_42470, partial [Streptomyces sp. PSKA30]|nr:hypothetical protein [Streptomyces sp. PSKA30]